MPRPQRGAYDVTRAEKRKLDALIRRTERRLKRTVRTIRVDSAGHEL